MRLQMIVVLALAVAGCSGNGKKTTPTGGGGSGSGSELPDIVAQTMLGWGLQAATAGKLNLFLEVTDHTGQAKSYPLGESAVPCTPAKGNGGDIITTLMCLADGTGAELRAVFRANQIIVLRRPIDPSDDPGDIELSFREVTRVEVPVGSKVSAAE